MSILFFERFFNFEKRRRKNWFALSSCDSKSNRFRMNNVFARFKMKRKIENVISIDSKMLFKSKIAQRYFDDFDSITNENDCIDDWRNFKRSKIDINEKNDDNANLNFVFTMWYSIIFLTFEFESSSKNNNKLLFLRQKYNFSSNFFFCDLYNLSNFINVK